MQAARTRCVPVLCARALRYCCGKKESASARKKSIASENDTSVIKRRTIVFRPTGITLKRIKSEQVGRPERSQHGAQFRQMQGILTLPVWKRVLRCEGRQKFG